MPGHGASRMELDRAHATILSATAMFETLWSRRTAVQSESLRARVIGNGLRELDRFLNVLLDEAIIAAGGAPAPAMHNTANKFAGFRPVLSHDHRRLRALGRSRQCLFYYDGIVSRGDDAASLQLTVGWWEDTASTAARRLRRIGIGNRLHLTREDLLEVGGYYTGLANEVTFGAPQPAPAM